MRRILIAALPLLAIATASSQSVHAQAPPPPETDASKKNANPCRDEVSAALQKLRKSSWFRMETSMITEKGPTKMQVDYVLPDRMHQKTSVAATNETFEIILVGDEAWSRAGEGQWSKMKGEITQQLKAQMQEQVVEQQADVGNYACKGRTSFEGREVLSYKLEDEPAKDSTAPRNEAIRMFYVDVMTGMPVSNAIVVPGRETKPLFKATYAFPLDIKIEPPKDVAAP